MRPRMLGLLSAMVLGLAGCATEPQIPEGQLSAQEIRDGVAAVEEKRWIAPLTDEQKAALNEARRAWSENELDRARSLLGQLLESRPDHPDLLANAAMVALAQDEREEARLMLEEALKVAPGHRVASNNLSLILKAEGDFIESRKVLTRALEHHPDEPTLHYNLAVIYELYLQDLEKALEHYQRYQALSAEPDPKVAGWVTDIERRLQ